eukprot:7512547-Ditylum_brightwellii.AAC.1
MSEATDIYGASEDAAALMTKTLHLNEEETSVQFQDINNNKTSTQTNKKSHKLNQAKICQDERLECIKQCLELLSSDSDMNTKSQTLLKTKTKSQEVLKSPSN